MHEFMAEAIDIRALAAEHNVIGQRSGLGYREITTRRSIPSKRFKTTRYDDRFAHPVAKKRIDSCPRSTHRLSKTLALLGRKASFHIQPGLDLVEFVRSQ